MGRGGPRYTIFRLSSQPISVGLFFLSKTGYGLDISLVLVGAGSARLYGPGFPFLGIG